MAGTGDQESPRQQRPPRLPAPAPHTWTRWPPCSLRALSRTRRLRAGSGGWNRGDARLHSSILGAGSTLQSAVHFLFQKERESVLAEGGAEQPRSKRACGRARGSGLHNRPSSLRLPRRGPQHPARFPGPGLPLPAAAPVLRSSPSCRTHLPACRGLHRSRFPRGGQRALGLRFPSASPPLPCLRLPREESPPGRCKDKTRALPGEREAASMQIWEVRRYIPADPRAAGS